MIFCVGLITYFQSLGFDTTGWRKSTDGTQTIVHDLFVSVLDPEYLTDTNITCYDCPGADLTELLTSTAWTVAE